MKIPLKQFRVSAKKYVRLKGRPTVIRPFYGSKKQYHKLLQKHVEALSSLQNLHYANGRYALLLIFQG